jgi:phospholipid/cholesterol/gamma-HCH transport system substrate-binding protein
VSRAFRLGVFIVSTLAILIVGVFLIGDRQFLFSRTYEVRTAFKNVSGLVGGAEVRIGGIHKGTVTEIEMPSQPGGLMTVVMNLERSTRKIVRKDSVASIQTEGLLGSKYVEISFGSDKAPPIDNGGSIASVPPLDISDLMKKTNEILETTQQTMSNVQEGTDHFKEIGAKIDQGQGTMGALVNDRKMYDRLNETASQAKLGAAAFQENMEALKHNFFVRGFFNKRGYEDSTKLSAHEIAGLPRASYLKRFRYDAAKVFDDVDTAKLKNGKPLNEAGRFLEGNTFGTAVVVVSGGMKGDAAEVQTLTRARAMIVRDYLVQNFKMDDTRVNTMGLGKNPQVSNDAGIVEVVVYPAGSRVRPAKASPAK